jgi:hypothetical protein
MNEKPVWYFGCFILLIVLGLAFGCGKSEPGEEPAQEAKVAEEEAEGGHSHEEGPHGGSVVVVGDHVAHLEIIHHCEDTKLAIYILGEDMKTPVEADGDVLLNIKTVEEPTQITAKPLEGASSFEFVDPVLGSHELEGQVVLPLMGKTYYVTLPEHAHEHEGDHEEKRDHEEIEDHEEDHVDDHDH